MQFWWDVSSCASILILLDGYPSLFLAQTAVILAKLCVPIHQSSDIRMLPFMTMAAALASSC